MANPGAFPVDPTSPVGVVRSILGDTISQPLDPPVSGQEDFRLFSDMEIEAFLAQAAGSPVRASGWAYLSLAGAASHEAYLAKDYDLQYDGRQKAAQFREQASYYFSLADIEDASGEDAFTIVPTGADCSCGAELAANQWGYCGRCG